MLEHSPLVTIVVLTYHKFDRIKNNLESIAKQEYPHIEVLIQDDGSSNFDRDYLEGLCNATLGHRKWRVHQNEQNLDMSASCCMEIAGIESMIPGVEAPKVGSMLGERE